MKPWETGIRPCNNVKKLWNMKAAKNRLCKQITENRGQKQLLGPTLCVGMQGGRYASKEMNWYEIENAQNIKCLISR